MVTIKLPASRLTGRQGICNLLTFMGTGQSYRTSSFLGLSNAEKPGGIDGFYSENLEECLKLFEDAVQKNSDFMASKGGWSHQEVWEFAGEEKYGSEKGFYQISDQKVWGEPNQLLSARPLKRNGMCGYKKLSYEQKFAPYWTMEIQEKWVKFLENMLGQDPAQYKGARHTFSYTLDFIQALGLDGFRTGLTSFQTTVNLCFKSICLPPTIDELVSFIAQNSGLGAYNGLVELGFCLSNKAEIRCALRIIYDHLEHHLSPTDAELLAFTTHSWIVIEHILCKVARYTNRVDSMGTWAKEAEEKGKWIKKRGEKDYMAFPIALLGTREKVEAIISLYK
ncbi:hypothetical protein BDP27DRAFT_1246740 [Rhodocollybia butyracea]|uniref:Uncharacterized protein n=1 Tax=Rhodocollybia butyracea TaxID=206335 RepID=A0A9P5TVH1_9AGAR|nr:hypothetical protein BDP27DRAFT_1246740 [Rhodocollybia butyracea]